MSVVMINNSNPLLIVKGAYLGKTICADQYHCWYLYMRDKIELNLYQNYWALMHC